MTTYAWPGFLAMSREGDEWASRWVGLFRSIGEKLSFVVPEE